MKKHKALWIILLGLVSIVGFVFFSNPKIEPVNPKKIAQVKVLKIAETVNQEFAKYIGIIQPLEIHQATFSTIGTIDVVYVKEGDFVKQGQLLVTLNNEQAQINLSNAQQSLQSANFSRSEAAANLKAEQADYLDKKSRADQILEEDRLNVLLLKSQRDEAYDLYQNNLDEFGADDPTTISSYNAYIAANIEYEIANASYQVSLQADDPVEVQIASARVTAAQASYNAANVQYNIALNNVTAARNSLNETRLLSNLEGVVIRVLSNRGELATPLAPVVIVATHQSIAVIGLSQSSIQTISKDLRATIIVNQNEYQGYVFDVSLIPDATSRTYQAKIKFDSDHRFNIGETANVLIDLGERVGIWLPLAIIMNDGEDFVYVVEDGRIAKRIITLGSLSNDQVLTQGLKPFDQVVIEGGKLLRPGIEVEIFEVVNSHD